MVNGIHSLQAIGYPLDGFHCIGGKNIIRGKGNDERFIAAEQLPGLVVELFCRFVFREQAIGGRVDVEPHVTCERVDNGCQGEH